MLIHLWSIVRWWDEWQLRILVLGSLGLQWFLLVAAPMRKYTIPQWFRKCIWLAYVSSDALAVYALATLFNRHSKASSRATSCGGDINGGQASVLEILWAPILLIHLGGQMELTAYNIEDNELWMRHTVTLVSQVAVAVYAFYKSWPNSTDKRLWAAAVLLFIIGVLSFSEKPWAFRRARIQRLAAVSSLIQQGRRRDEGKWKKAYRFCFTDIEEQMLKREKEAAGGQGKVVMSKRDRLHMIMSDMSLFAAESELKTRHAMKMKRMSQGGGDNDDNMEVLEVLSSAERFSKPWLRKAFRLIYTRANVMYTPAYLAYHLLLVPALHLAAITLFAVSHKRGRYNPTDVKATYVLLFFTAALDVFALFFRATLYYLMDVAKVPSLCEWIAQYNLIDAALRRLEPATGWLVKCAACFGCHEGYFACFKRDELYSKVAGRLIVDLFKSSDDQNIKGLDLGNYRNFDTVKEVEVTVKEVEVVEEGGEVSTTTRTVKEVETRTVKAKINANNWALNKELRDKASTEVRSSLLGSFDRSVLLWHIATDLCFCLNPPTAPTNPREVITEAISNYMAHLLNFRPDMLLTGSRRHLFVEAMEQVEDILGEDNRLRTGRHLKHLIDVRALVETIFLATLDEHGCRDKDTCDSNNTSSPPKYALVHDACRLAQQLLRLEDEDTRYELMYRVWLGMLFYSAAMCRGYQHAKSLGEGGEFLSFVWLLLSIKGCKTLSDKLQMPDEPDSGDHQETQDTPWPEVNLKEDWGESA